MAASRKDFMTQKIQEQPSDEQGKWLRRLWLLAAWTWTILAAGGGLMLLIERGPWPLTNGWFALGSGMAACPGTAWLAKRTFGMEISGRARFVVAVLIWLTGQLARRVGI